LKVFIFQTINKKIQTIDPKSAATARGYLKWIHNFKFIFLTKLLLIIYQRTQILCEALQHSEMDVASAKELTEATILDLIALKDEESLKLVFESSCNLAK
jgi:hypothetical protein